MGGVASYILHRSDEIVLSACVDQILSRPLAEVTVKSVVMASGLTEWRAYRAVRRVARDRAHLISRAVSLLAARIIDQIEAAPAQSGSVYETIESTVKHMSQVMRGAEYENLYRLLLRDGGFHPWLREIYEERAAGAFCARLEGGVRNAGREIGVAVYFRPGAPRETLRRLEWALLLPRLVPGGSPMPEDEAVVVTNVAREAFAQTCAWDLGEAA
jgi:hypothetical protein